MILGILSIENIFPLKIAMIVFVVLVAQVW